MRRLTGTAVLAAIATLTAPANASVSDLEIATVTTRSQPTAELPLGTPNLPEGNFKVEPEELMIVAGMRGRRMRTAVATPKRTVNISRKRALRAKAPARKAGAPKKKSAVEISFDFAP